MHCIDIVYKLDLGFRPLHDERNRFRHRSAVPSLSATDARHVRGSENGWNDDERLFDDGDERLSDREDNVDHQSQGQHEARIIAVTLID